MAQSSTEGHLSTECDLAADESVGRSRRPSTHHRHVRGVAAYYRLRTMALEAQVATLTTELNRTEQRLQETIARYEEILQRRPDCDGVVVPPGDD